jgi:sensor histidine kinase YesM
VLKSDIEEAKTLPAPGVGSYPSLDLRDPLVAWPPSKHQYNDQYDNIIDAITDMEEELEDLNDKVRDLELKVAKLEK